MFCISSRANTGASALYRLTRGWKGSLSNVRELHINVWSNPKTAAVSLMQSFGERNDSVAFDEPMYKWQKAETGELSDFNDYLSPILSVHKDDINGSNKSLINLMKQNDKQDKNKIYFYKNMGKQLFNPLNGDSKVFDYLFKNKNVRNIFLVRDPRELIVSLEDTLMNTNYTLNDTGFDNMVQLLDKIKLKSETTAKSDNEENEEYPFIPVIKHEELISRPEHVLRSICEDFQIKFDDKMLEWTRYGYQQNNNNNNHLLNDSPWASQWYLNGIKFNKFSGPKYGTLKPWKYVKMYGEKQENIITECRNNYNNLISSNYLRAKALLWDKKNRNIIVGVNGNLYPRSEAKVSVWDSVVWGGDGVWEGIRIYDGRLFAFDKHIQRLFDSAKATNVEWVPTKNEIFKQVCQTLNANKMYNNAHIRLTMTRGEKVMAGPSQYLCQSKPNIIVLAEWKKPVFDNKGGARLVTVALRRNSPLNLDSKIHHNNMLNNILAKIQSDYCDAEDALMLDNDGYVAETNATNIFLVKNNKLLTPNCDFCLPGITRSIIIDYIANNKNNNIKLIERRISLSEIHSADEVFMVGTMGEITPVLEVDNRKIKNGLIGDMTKKISKLFNQLTTNQVLNDLSTVIDKTITKDVSVAQWKMVNPQDYWKNEQINYENEKKKLLKHL